MAGEQLSLSCGQNRLSRVTGRRAGFAVPAVTPEGPHDLATVLGCCASHFLSHPTPGPPQPGSHSCAALDSSPILHWGSSPASATWAVGASFWPELPSFLGPQCLSRHPLWASRWPAASGHPCEVQPEILPVQWNYCSPLALGDVEMQAVLAFSMFSRKTNHTRGCAGL